MNKIKTYLLFLLPVFYIFYNASFNMNIINPYSYLVSISGYLALSMLIFVIAMPTLPSLRSYIDRRSIGFITFIYAFLHLALYIIDNSLNLEYLILDLIEILYIQIGYAAFLLFFPLLFTSTDRLKKTLANKWIILHRLIYMILFFSLIHYYIIIKADYYTFIVYLVIIASILIIKLKRYKNE